MHMTGQAGLNVKGIIAWVARCPKSSSGTNIQGTLVFRSQSCHPSETDKCTGERILFLQKGFQAKPSGTTPSRPPPTSPMEAVVSLLSCELLCHVTKGSLLTFVTYVISSPVRSPQKGIIQLILTIFTARLEGTRHDGHTLTITVALIKSFRN